MPIVNGKTNMSNGVGFIFHQGFASVKNDVTNVDAARTNECAFSAKHTAVNLFSELGIIAALQQGVQAANVECGQQIARRAGGGAGSAGHTNAQRRLILQNRPHYLLVVAVVVDTLRFCYLKAPHS